MIAGPVVVATRNEHKLRELGEVLAGVRLEPLPESVELPPEDGNTYAENALIKARAGSRATGLPVIGDDSGIEAAALGGAPGVRSARFAGAKATDAENLEKLLSELAGASDRRLTYVCVIALVAPGGEERLFEGRCTGRLAEPPRGTGGFGYDPAFAPEDFDDGRTMAELGSAEKHSISHRGRAARELYAYLRERE